MRTRPRDFVFGALALALLILGSSDVFADTKTFGWTAPSTYTDGSPLLPSDLQRYELECNDTLMTTFPGDVETAPFDFLKGTYTCVLFAVDVDGLRSGPSNQVFFTIASPPSAPAALSVD